MDDDDEKRIERLCPELRAILDAELAAGNAVGETWEGWGFMVLFRDPFRVAHVPMTEDIAFRDVNDPHYWKAEYRCRVHDQTVGCRFGPLDGYPP